MTSGEVLAAITPVQQLTVLVTDWLKRRKKIPCCSERGLVIATTTLAFKTSIAFSFGQGTSATRGWCGQRWRMTCCSSGNTMLKLQQTQLSKHSQRGTSLPKVATVVISVLIPVFFCVKVISECCTRIPLIYFFFLENAQVKRGLSVWTTRPNAFFCVAVADQSHLNQCCHHPLPGTWSTGCEELVSLSSSLDSHLLPLATSIRREQWRNSTTCARFSSYLNAFWWRGLSGIYKWIRCCLWNHLITTGDLAKYLACVFVPKYLKIQSRSFLQ